MTDLPQKEEVQETTPQAGSESEPDLEQVFSELFPEDDSEDKKTEFLAQINKIEGRQYKSVDDYVKTVKERNKAFSEQGRKAKEAKPVAVSNDKYAEKLLILENKNSKYVMEELKEISKQRGIDILEAWDKYSWVRKEAEARAEAEKEKEQNEKKVSKPSSKISGKGGGAEELSDADRALLSRRPGLMEKYLKQTNK